MRNGAALLTICVLFLCAIRSLAAGAEPGEETGGGRPARGPYLLRQIFGDLPRSSPELWGLSPGMLRREVPAETDLGEKQAGAGSLLAFTREVSGRATVTFVFDGGGEEARMDHITVTVFQAPNISPKSFVAYLTRIYGPPDPAPPAGLEEILGSWRDGGILLRHFSASRFFEVTLASLPPSHPAP